ncbi:MAG: hypothetical protein RRY99_06110 [Flavobacterium sp.]
MKKIYLLAILCIVITSCSTDDAKIESTISANEKKEIFNFSSFELMNQKINEINILKEEMEKSTSQKYTTNQSILSENEILTNLKNYHTDRLNDIYTLRKKVNFMSIESIADEINSLKIVDPDKSNELFLKYEQFLTKNKFQITTIFKNGIGNVTNEHGKVLIDGQNIDSQNSTARYVYDESVKEDLAAISSDWRFHVFYATGREKHKDTFGKVFFRYFTEFRSYYTDFNGVTSLCPATYSVTNNSIAGFSQSGDNPFADFAFSMQYPSGNGSTIRQTSGQIWTAYQPEGGYINASFSGAGYVITCDFKYKR